jgi:hypothetical protein
LDRKPVLRDLNENTWNVESCYSEASAKISLGKGYSHNPYRLARARGAAIFLSGKVKKLPTACQTKKTFLVGCST